MEWRVERRKGPLVKKEFEEKPADSVSRKPTKIDWGLIKGFTAKAKALFPLSDCETKASTVVSSE